MRSAKADSNQEETNSFLTLRKLAETFPIDTTGLWSYPALIRTKENIVYRLILVLGSSYLSKEKKTALFRPKSMMITDQAGRQIFQFQNFRIGEDPFDGFDWRKPVGVFPHQGLSKEMSYQDLEKEEKQLLSLYPEVSAEFGSSGSLSQEFKRMYLKLGHPSSLPFLNKLAPEFVQELVVSSN